MKSRDGTGRAGGGGAMGAAFLWVAVVALGAAGGCAGPAQPGNQEPARGADLLKTPVPLFEEEARSGAAARGAPGPAASPLPASSVRAAEPAVPERGVAESETAIRTADAATAVTAKTVFHETGGSRFSSAGALGGAAQKIEPAMDPLEELFQTCRERFRSALTHPPADDYAAIERADLEAKLIALFFLRDRKNLEDYRDLLKSFREEGTVHVELELLKAALYQKLGQAELRDRSMARAGGALSPAASGLRVVELAFARDIRGYRNFTRLPSVEFSPGESLLLYGELEGFKSTPAARPGGAMAHRRSFAADLVLKSAQGVELDRRELLRAGQAVELAEDAARPVHFWGRYPLSPSLAPGDYRLEVEATDLEGQKKARTALPFKVR